MILKMKIEERRKQLDFASLLELELTSDCPECSTPGNNQVMMENAADYSHICRIRC